MKSEINELQNKTLSMFGLDAEDFDSEELSTLHRLLKSVKQK